MDCVQVSERVLTVVQKLHKYMKPRFTRTKYGIKRQK